MFNWMLNQAVTITPYKGQSGTGKPIYDAPYPEMVRIEAESRKITDRNGNEVIAGGFVMLPAKTRIADGSVINWEGANYKLIKTAPCILASSNTETHVEGWFK